jgi:hypothetical protein
MRYRVGIDGRVSCTERTALRPAASERCRAGRRTRRGTMLLAGALAATLAACGANENDARREPGSTSDGGTAAGESEPAGGAAVGAAVGAKTAIAPGAKPICPATGAWQLCSVVERLERAGLAPRQEPERVREAPLSAPGVALMLGRSELRVFIYADRGARERDQAKLDATKYVRATDPLSMQAEPTLIATENLLAILRSRNDHQRERVADALTAGPPQSPGPGTKG